MRLAVTTFILLTFAGCSTISRTVNNARQPRVESEESLNKWLKQTGLNGYDVLTVAPESFIETSIFYFKRNLVFNKDGKVAELGTNQTGVVCHFKTPGEIENLKPNFPEFTEFLISYRQQAAEEYADTTYYNLDTLNKYVHTRAGTKTKIDSESDYVVIIPFARYLGRTIQTADIKKYLRAVKANRYSTFKVILLNLDKQMWWGEKWNNAIKIST